MIERFFHAIEDPKLAARVNVVSGYNQFKRAIAELPEIRSLLEEVEDHPVNLFKIVERTGQLALRPYDKQFENPLDIAFAAYLHVLNEQAQELAKVLAEQLVQKQKNLWWAKKLAMNLVALNDSQPPRSDLSQTKDLSWDRNEANDLPTAEPKNAADLSSIWAFIPDFEGAQTEIERGILRQRIEHVSQWLRSSRYQLAQRVSSPTTRHSNISITGPETDARRRASSSMQVANVLTEVEE